MNYTSSYCMAFFAVKQKHSIFKLASLLCCHWSADVKGHTACYELWHLSCTGQLGEENKLVVPGSPRKWWIIGVACVYVIVCEWVMDVKCGCLQAVAASVVSTAQFAISNQYMIGDYVLPPNVILPPSSILHYKWARHFVPWPLTCQYVTTESVELGRIL